MESIFYDEFDNLQSNNSGFPIINPALGNPIFPNFDYLKKSLPYMDYQMMRNALKEQSLVSFQEYVKENHSLLQNILSGSQISDLNNFSKYQNDSPIKSTIDDSKSKIYHQRKKKDSKNNNKDKANIKDKDNYIGLLINTIDNLFAKGEITKDYLNSKSYPKFTPDKFCLSLKEKNLSLEEENSSNNFSKKCDNKSCAYLADNPHKLFQAKFYTSKSYKSKNLWLCEKCYKAFLLQNYCYYCHTVYREYDHGTQYYDRKKWIQCDYCSKWHHIQCEEKRGKYENIEDLSMNNNFKYMCPFCRKEHESIIRQKHKDEKMKKNYENMNNNNNCRLKNNFLTIKRRGIE